jgi:hypothetical protein
MPAFFSYGSPGGHTLVKSEAYTWPAQPGGILTVHLPSTGLFRTLMAILAAAMLLPSPLHAQSDAATVLGTVRDSSDSVVPGATVTLRNVSTGITAVAVTDENGNYQFLNVRIGTYTVRAELQGFSVAEAVSTEPSPVTISKPTSCAESPAVRPPAPPHRPSRSTACSLPP